MTFRDSFRSIASFLVALALANSAHSVVKPPIDLEIDVPARTASPTLRATVSVQDHGPAVGIRIRVAGEGVFGIYPFEDSIWSENHVLELEERPLGNGTGALTITAEALDADGEVLYLRRVKLHSLVEAGVIWSSPSSLTDARIRRVEHLSLEKSLSAQQRSEMMEEIVTARAIVDRAPYEPQPLTPHQWKLQNAFGSAPTGDQTKNKQRATTKGTVTVTVQGIVRWTDSGGKTHSLPMASVEIRDDDAVGSELIATTTTDAAGNYSSVITHDDGLLQGDPDIFVRVLARSPVADIKPDSLLASTYRMESPVNNEVADGTTLSLNLTAGNTADSETVFSVHHALVMIGGYAGTIAGTMPSQVDTRFPTTRATSLFNGTQLHILQMDRWDWDVVHHEYGHYFMAIHGFQDNPGGSHGFGDNLAAPRGKDAGLRLAWGEGWPTFFGISGQSATSAATLLVPNVGDVSYQDTEDSTANINLETSTGRGEDNEVSVFASLWDLFDTQSDGLDDLNLSDRTLFTTFRDEDPTTVGAAWDALAAPLDKRERTLVGGVLAQADIAPELTAPAENFTVSAASPPTFRWMKNGGGTPNPLNDFTIKFYLSDFSSMTFEKDLGDTDNFTPTAAEFATIVGSGVPVKWVVEGKNTSAPESPGGAVERYWSQARTLGGVAIALVIDDTGSMIEEIAGVRNALQDFINEVEARLGPDETPPTVQLITFKDSVTNRIITNNLGAVRTAVASLTASGGGDCPEFSAQALQLAAANIAAGGTILLATDASSQPGVDMGAVVARLRSKGVSLNTILSGDCGGIESSSTQGVFDSSALTQARLKKPGDEDPSQGPITDPGQDPLDAHGDSMELATRLFVDQEAARGQVGIDPADIDYFQFELEAGESYTVRFELEEVGAGATFRLRDQDGVTFLDSTSAFDTLPRRFVFTPGTSGDYFLTTESSGTDTPTPYRVRVLLDDFAALESAVGLFSTASALTNGAFIVRDDINFGGVVSYEAAIFNTLVSTLGPTVLAADPAELPRGTTITINLTGADTDWRSGSLVSFSNPALEVVDVDVLSSISLNATVSVGSSAVLDFSDVEVRTLLGEEQVARGRDVVEVVGAFTVPTLLGIEPNTLSLGETRQVTIRGVNTAWTESSTVSLGDGLTVGAVNRLSPALLTAQVSVDADARIGFRQAVVETLGSGIETKNRAVFVGIGAVGLPEIIVLSPSEGLLGEAIDVLVTGANTNFQAGVSTADFGSGVDVLMVDVIDTENAVVRVSIAPDAVLGFRDVSLTTSSEVAVILDGFFVSGGSTPLNEIPTLSQWSLIFLALVLAFVGLRQLNYRWI